MTPEQQFAAEFAADLDNLIVNLDRTRNKLIASTHNWEREVLADKYEHLKEAFIEKWGPK